jgi:hypothetical protein
VLKVLLVRCVLAASILPVLPANAFQVEHRAVQFADRHYRFELVVTLDAPADKVQAVLRDYEHYPDLDKRILEAKVIGRPQSNVATLQTLLRACFGPFCRNVHRIEQVTESPYALAAISDPERSDVKFGESFTALSRIDADHSRVSYRTDIVPDFWIPSLIGRHFMLKTLEDATTTLFRNVERKAQALDGG